MRKVLALGATILFVGSVGVAGAQERLQQSGGSAMGVGTGVGDISGSANRVQAFDRNSFLDRLSLPETIYGRVLAIDFPAGKLHLETGGSSHDEGRAGAGTMNSLVVFFDDKTNMDQVRTLNAGDDISLQVYEATTNTQQFGVGRKIVREVYLLRGNERLAGFGGLGQRPNPSTERAIETNSGGITGGVAGSVLPGKVTGTVDTTISEFTGAAPCWNCEPQPGIGFSGQSRSDYGGSDYSKPNLVKGLN
ncbi:MAG: hypothetical protein H8K08_06275 [Nitrospira sp.]|jgi:hypothetical protein|nr:hypothetical protein [Nitrospira sp.]